MEKVIARDEEDAVLPEVVVTAAEAAESAEGRCVGPNVREEPLPGEGKVLVFELKVEENGGRVRQELLERLGNANEGIDARTVAGWRTGDTRRR